MYNGFKNYETYRVILECTDCWTAETIGHEYDYGATVDANIWDAAQLAEELVYDVMNEGVEPNSFASSAITMWLQEVHWREVAEHILADDVKAHLEALAQQESTTKPLTPSTTLFAA